MEELLLELVMKHPALMTVVAVVGTFRLVFKPLVAGIKAVVAASPSKADDAVVEKVEASKAFKTMAWLADYLLSIKLPGQK